jgi:hypothetical protein
MVGPPVYAPSRRRVLLALGIAAAWIVALATLALNAANPIVLNRAQVRQAAVVVSARVIDLAGGECAVEGQWAGPPIAQTIRVANLHETRAAGGATYILPLDPVGEGAFAVIPAPLDGEPRLVYPATEDVVAQVEELLGRPAFTPAPAGSGR